MIHTDLKPENILFESPKCQIIGLDAYKRVVLNNQHTPLTKRGERVVLPASPDIKVIDFGSALFSQWPRPKTVNTRQYRAPEVACFMD